ncbi:unnamed protein product [Parnassius apollo]|uniref:E3 ubiquitin-protein ligase n=1 Tax=Parnassius apollo TaxID=110799 RepID=A0A8S3W9U1_PARAO|nr:unnamed protein product [Parnassius apollo]
MVDVQNDLQEQACGVCLEKYNHPTKLPCGHVFCFLCVKGIAIQNKKCAMCRTEIPHDYLNNPVLLDNILEKNSKDCRNHDYQWYYEGRNGWWKYDERSNCDLEAAFVRGEKDCKLLLAGALYRVDFEKNLQVRQNDQTKRRRVRRDMPTLPSKGIAGIKTSNDNPREEIEAELHREYSENPENNQEIPVSEDSNSNASEEDLISEMSHSLSNITLRTQEEAASDLPDTENR